MKRGILGLIGFALTLAATPAVAQESEPMTSEEAAAMSELFLGAFTADPLTAEQEARLPAANAIIEQMMPEGFYREMMASSLDAVMEPMLGMISGETGARMVLTARLDLAADELEAISDEDAIELAKLLDPGFSGRGEVAQGFLEDLMVDMADAMEPGFRTGMARAYAVRFDAAQLAELSAFFATPTGRFYASENIRIMSDPQVMSASMEAMPVLFERFAGMEAEIKAAMEALPSERKFGELTSDQRSRIASVLEVEETSLANIVLPPTGAMSTASDNKSTRESTGKQ